MEGVKPQITLYPLVRIMTEDYLKIHPLHLREIILKLLLMRKLTNI